MTYYRYWPHSNIWNGVKCANNADAKVLSEAYFLPPRPLLANWKIIELVPDNINPYSPDADGDFPYLMDAPTPVLSARAWRVLEPLLSQQVKAIPATHPLGEFVILNLTEEIDAIDHSMSELTPGAGRPYIGFTKLDRFYLKYDLLKGRHICRTPVRVAAGVLIDDEFRKIVELHNLKGLQFREFPVVNPA